MSERWSEHDKSRLGTLAEAGLTAAFIARILARTKSAVYAKASELSISLSGEAITALRALDAGVPLVRDVVPCTGEKPHFFVHWTPASRSSDLYVHGPAMEALLAAGLLRRLHGETYGAA